MYRGGNWSTNDPRLGEVNHSEPKLRKCHWYGRHLKIGWAIASMTNDQENRLIEMATRVERLRKTVNKTDSMIRSWARRKSERKAFGTTINEISLWLSDRGNHKWSVGIDLPSEMIDKELIPILKRVRDRARSELRSMEASI